MIAADDKLSNSAITQAVNQGVRDQEIIEAPTNVLGASVHHVRPKGISAAYLGIKMAKCVDHLSISQQLGESFSLLGSEPAALFVVLKIFQIDFVMSNVEIAANDGRFLFVQFLDTNLTSDETLMITLTGANSLGKKQANIT